MILLSELQYFPLINWYIDAVKIGTVCFCEDDLFKKSTFRNRMMIAGAGGLLQLSIPIVGGRNCKLPFREVLIETSSDWQLLHFKSICSAYGKSPWFSHYQPELEEIFLCKSDSLMQWNLRCHNWVTKKLKLEKLVRIAGIKPFENVEVLERINFYIPSNYNKLESSAYIRYPQVFQYKYGFCPNLSILDLLFNEGPNSTKYIMDKSKTDCL